MTPTPIPTDPNPHALTTMHVQRAIAQECGCPSSTVLQSSPEQQADFVTAVFTEWRRHGSDKLPFISFFKLRDWDDAHCTAATRGQVAGQPFFEFLRSLGLAENDGTPKPALSALSAGIANFGR